jgi:IS30 family transposase
MDHNQSEIANVIGVHKSTISRELWRNCGRRGYRPQQAHRMAISRRNKSVDRVQPETWSEIDHWLCNDWNPEQVSGWLKSRKDLHVSHEWIYQHVLADKRNGGDLYHHVRCKKKRRKRYGSYDRRGILPNRVSIDQRPGEVNTRQRLGDWEVDTIIGKRHKQAIVTLVERKSRLVLLRKVQERSAGAVTEAITH